MSVQNPASYEVAVRDFRRARKEAAIQQILARITSKSTDLLAFDMVRKELRPTGKQIDRGLQEVPLDSIVGSVSRYKDFTRSFLPKRDSDEERWAKVKAAVTDMVGMPPIEVYQVGDAYFVKDGNHRVSVARQLGSETISAYVTEVKTRVPLTADDDEEEVICKVRYADFLETTNLDKMRPEADLMMTFCGQYQVLLDQIEAERALISQRRPDLNPNELQEEATVNWYDNVYLPVIRIIREMGIMREFPGLTEADIYILLSERRAELEKGLGWQIDTEETLPDLVSERVRRPPLLGRLIDAVAPELEEGPPAGEWRARQLALHRGDHLFADILVLLEGIEGDWEVLDQVIRMAELGNDRILGLHVVKDQSLVDTPAVSDLRAEFERRCGEAGMVGEFAVEAGAPYLVIAERAAWADLVVINLTHPPESQPLARLRPGWAQLIQRCPRPILTIPNAMHSDMDRALVAYDGSAKANEALFVATYLAARWQIALTILTVVTNKTGPEALDQARDYLLQHGINQVNYVLEEGSIGDAILATAAEHQCNLLIVGGFGLRPVQHLVLGSTVERMLREMPQPMLICR